MTVGPGNRRTRDQEESPYLIVPIGSWEQHGPHLPPDTDARIARELSQRLITVVNGRRSCVLGPTVTISASGEHQGFANTLSIGTDVTSQVLIEICRSASWTSGVVMVNGHGGNSDAIDRARAVLEAESRSALFWSPPLEDVRDSHAGRVETSVMLAIAPHEVRVDSIEAGIVEPLPSLIGRLRASGVRSVSANGVLGDPRSADADTGRDILHHWTEALVAAFDRWCALR